MCSQYISRAETSILIDLLNYFSYLSISCYKKKAILGKIPDVREGLNG